MNIAERQRIDSLTPRALKILLKNDLCPICLHDLDIGWECNSCEFDAMPLVQSVLGSEAQKGEGNG